MGTPTSCVMSIQSVQAGSEGQVEAALAVLRVDGVVCIRGAWSQQQTAEFKEAYDQCWAATKSCVAASSGAVWERRVFHHMDSPTAPLDKVLYNRMPILQLNSNVDRTDAASRGQYSEKSVLVRMGCGRYDFTLGMEDTVLAQSDFLHPPAVAPILGQLLGAASEWISYPGGLPAEGSCKDGKWHRDTYSLWEEQGMADAQLPPWYLTMIAPLTHLKEADGPTQFRLGSHHMTAAEAPQAPVAFTELAPGDVLLFDGRIVHRGGARSKHAGARHVIYSVHHKWWYTDDDMVPPTTRLEPLTHAEVAVIEQEEPWLRRQPAQSSTLGLGMVVCLAGAVAFLVARHQRK